MKSPRDDAVGRLVKIDRERFLVLTATIAMGFALTPGCTNEPPPQAPVAPPAPATTVIYVMVPAAPTPAPSLLQAQPQPQPQPTSLPAPSPVVPVAASPDPYKGTPIHAQSCDVALNAQGNVPACSLRAPGPTCESFSDTRTECPTLTKLLKPRVAQAAIECMNRRSGTKDICEFNVTSICAYEALQVPLRDLPGVSLTGHLDKIILRCKTGGMFDLKIVGGTVVDGTGSTAFAGDVAVTGGRIVAIGDCSGPAKRIIDARGAHVLPGFVDIHTHYDGQVTWDEELTPSSIHGVTTCVMGSCGVGFAPVRRGHEDELIELMEGVEDIPGSALAEGIPWGWESFAEYMDAIAAKPHAIDFMVQVPHDPLRMYVMRERAIVGEAATDDDVAAMRDLLRAALEAGAAGFSTGRTDNHRTARGAHTPASEASARELAGIATAFAGFGRGVMQAVSDFDMMVGPERFDAEFDVLEGMVTASGGRPLSISTMQRDHALDQWRRIFARVDSAAQRGLDMRCQVGARGIGVLLGLEATFHPFMGFPSYKAIAELPLADRVAAMRTPEVRARILAEKSDKVAGDGTPIPPLADFFLANLDMLAMRLYRMGERPNYEPAMDTCIAAEAMRAGVPLLERIYDAILEDDGKAFLYFPIYNYSGLNLDVVREMLTYPRALMGLGDAGAHVGTVCDASMPTFLLTHWARDRKEGIPLERVVAMQTRDTARFIGLRDRGTVELGQRADLNVIDLARLSLKRPVMQRDLPAGGRRLVQRADGYLATLVGGELIAENGELTGARPGKLVRI